MSEELFNNTLDESGDVKADAVASFLNATDNEPKEVVEDESPDSRVEFKPDTSMKQSATDFYNNMLVPIDDSRIRITEQDKHRYVTSSLLGEEICLAINVLGTHTITCRSISVYETNLIVAAMEMYMRKARDKYGSFADMINANSIAMEALNQSMRVALHATAVDSKPIKYLHYVKTEGVEMEQHAQDLLDKCQQAHASLAYNAYSLRIKAVNIFLHKINRLHEAAANEDFCNPGGVEL